MSYNNSLQQIPVVISTSQIDKLNKIDRWAF